MLSMFLALRTAVILGTVSCPPRAAHGSSQNRPQRATESCMVVKHVKLQTSTQKNGLLAHARTLNNQHPSQDLKF